MKILNEFLKSLKLGKIENAGSSLFRYVEVNESTKRENTFLHTYKKYLIIYLKFLVLIKDMKKFRMCFKIFIIKH